MTESQSGPAGSRATPALLLAVLVLASYGVALTFDFVWDDRPLIAENRRVQDPGRALELLTSSFWETGDRHDRFRFFFRPIVSMSYAADFAVWGLRPFGFHLTNLLLHWICCLLVHRLARDAGLDRAAALGGAALFALHPIHVESVAWISGRTDLLCAGFMLGAFLLHRRSTTSTSTWLRVAALGCFVLALLSKEMAATLPALIALDRWLGPGERRRRLGVAIRDTLPYAVTLAGYVTIRHGLVGSSAPLYALDAQGWLATASFVVARYLGLLLVPLGLDAHYPHEPRSALGDPLVVLSALMLAVVVWGAVQLRARSPRALLWLAWVSVTLLPVLAFGRFGDVIMADRFLYIPSAGAAILAAMGIARLVRAGPGSTRVATATVCIVLAVLGISTYRRTLVWRDDLTLFSNMVATSPGSALVRCNLGLALYDRGDTDAAIRELREAIEITPGYSMAHNNLAAALEQRGDHAAALRHYLTALRIVPGQVEAATNAGHLLARSGKGEEGLRLLHEVTRAHPGHSRALFALADTLDRMGRTGEAVPYLERAIASDPAYPNPYYLLGRIRHEQGRSGDAEMALRTFLDLWSAEDVYAERARRLLRGS